MISNVSAQGGMLASLDARVKFACLLVYCTATLHARSAPALAVCIVAAACMAIATRLTLASAARAVRPLAAILVITVVMQVLYVQEGAVLVQLGPVAVTQGALAASALMLAGLACIMIASLAFMRCTPSEQLVAAFGWMLGPLRAFGVRIDLPLLSLMVAFRFVPVLASDFSQLKKAQIARFATFDGSVRQRLRAYMRLFPPLVRGSFRRADRLAESFLARCFAATARRTSLNTGNPGIPDALAIVLMAAQVGVVVFLQG